MECKDKIAYIILGCLNGEYDINDFCDLYIKYYEELDEEYLSGYSQEWLRNLWEMCGRFSEFEEDFRLYPNVYFSENDIKEYLKKFSVSIFEK